MASIDNQMFRLVVLSKSKTFALVISIFDYVGNKMAED